MATRQETETRGPGAATVQPIAAPSHSPRTEFLILLSCVPKAASTESYPTLPSLRCLLSFPLLLRQAPKKRKKMYPGADFPTLGWTTSNGRYTGVTSKGHTSCGLDACPHRADRRTGHHLPIQALLLWLAGPGSCESKPVELAGSRRAGMQIWGGLAERC